MTGKGLFSASLRKAWQTFQRSRDFRPFIKFLAAFLVFNNGIMMTLDFAAIIGAVLFGLTQQQLIIFMIIVQITSVAGAFFFGRIASSLGAKTAILLSLGLMIVTIISLFYVDSLVVFNLIGALAGFSLTGVQSVSRAAIGELAPREKSAEFFGLFSMAGQISAFTGPAIYGFLATSLALMLERGGMPDHPAEVRGMRLALFAILAFLLCGGLLLASMRSWRKEASHE
jgi:UMF1 family MFS transporter